jgi:DNA-binding MarR family transcriptional regulator
MSEPARPADLRSLTELDRLIHEPARMVIVTLLANVESADFLYLQRETALTKGNLSSHMAKLEEAGYISVEKTYRGKIPLTLCRLTDTGQKAFSEYRRRLKEFVEHTAYGDKR